MRKPSANKIMSNKKYPLKNAGEDGREKILLECWSLPIHTCLSPELKKGY